MEIVRAPGLSKGNPSLSGHTENAEAGHPAAQRPGRKQTCRSLTPGLRSLRQRPALLTAPSSKPKSHLLIANTSYGPFTEPHHRNHAPISPTARTSTYTAAAASPRIRQSETAADPVHSQSCGDGIGCGNRRNVARRAKWLRHLKLQQLPQLWPQHDDGGRPTYLQVRWVRPPLSEGSIPTRFASSGHGRTGSFGQTASRRE